MLPKPIVSHPKPILSHHATGRGPFQFYQGSLNFVTPFDKTKNEACIFEVNVKCILYVEKRSLISKIHFVAAKTTTQLVCAIVNCVLERSTWSAAKTISTLPL